MKILCLRILLGSSIVLLLAAACSPKRPSTTSAEATALAAGATGLPTSSGLLPTLTGVTGTAPTSVSGTNLPPAIPVTGDSGAAVLCQFCVDTVAHAILVLPQTVTFILTANSSATTASSVAPLCNSVEVLNGKQVVICYGPPSTSLTLQLCEGSNCNDFQVILDPCPAADEAPPKVISSPVPPTEGSAPTEAPPTIAAPTATPGPLLPTPTSTP